MRMQSKIAVVLACLIGGLVLVITLFMYGNWFSAMQKQVALDARDQAIIIAENEAIQSALMIDNGYITVNRAVERIHLKTGIQYLYILNAQGRYFAHPIPEKVNTAYNEGDTMLYPLVSEPQMYYTLTTDAMVEAYVPVYTDGVPSGAVVVGIYNGRILQTIKGHAIRVVIIAVVAMVFGIAISYALSKNIKKAMFGLEPEAIGLLLNQQETILEHIGEGILATDASGKVLIINENAKKLLGIEHLKVGDDIHHHPVSKQLHLKEWRVENERRLKVETVALRALHPKLGTLYKLEDLSLVFQRAEELTDMKQLTQALRAQNHEFMNKLHTISGLIQLEAFDEALGYITDITKVRREMVDALNRSIKVPVLSGLILAKHSKALERHIQLQIDEDANVTQLPSGAMDADITSILGNLIDNAIDALTPIGGHIYLDMYHDHETFTMTVIDDGPGIDETLMPYITEKGFSTKGEGRGFGLSIVCEKVCALGGDISFHQNEGLTVSVILPMETTGGRDEHFNSGR